MPTLKTKVDDLAAAFAEGVLAAIRSSSLEEVLGESGRGSAHTVKRGPGRPRKTAATTPGGTSTGNPGPKKGGRLERRSPSDLEHVVGLIMSALASAPEGLRSEHLQRVLKLNKKEIVRPIELALKAKKIAKKGQKRSTTYYAQ